MTSPPTLASSSPTSRRRSTCRAAPCAPRSSVSSRTGSSFASLIEGPACGASRDDEAVEILQARAVLEGLAVRQAAERIDDAGVARLQACVARQRELLEHGDLLGASDANADLHATLLELSGHATAVRLIHTLNAQTVRYQYRTILIPGRPAASVAEHAAIVEAVVTGDAAEAELAMRRHLFNVADAVRRGLLPGGIDNASRGVL